MKVRLQIVCEMSITGRAYVQFSILYQLCNVILIVLIAFSVIRYMIK